MAITVPVSFSDEFGSLESSESFSLLKIQIETPEGESISLRFCLQKTIEWNSQIWPLSSYSLTGKGDRAGGEQVRPSLLLANPESIFSYYIGQGWLERARVTEYQVHPLDLEKTECISSTWYVSRVMEMNKKAISLQLSSLSDGNTFKLPVRRFTQPEFSLVRV